MSAIGDYIHYNKENYMREGITRGGLFKKWENQSKRIRDRAESESGVNVSLKDLNTIAESLEGIMSKGYIVGTPQETARKEIEKVLTEKYKEKLQNIDYTTGNVTLNKDAETFIGKARSNTKVASLYKKAMQLEQIIIDQAQRGNADAQKAVKQSQELKKYYDTISQEINAYKKRNKINITYTPEQMIEIKEKRKQLNALIEEFAAYPAIELQKGDFFETAALQLPTVAKGAVSAELKAIDREKVQINQDFFESDFITKDFGDMLEKTSWSQGKVDVEITWKGNSDVETVLKASLKNANLSHYYVRMVSGSSLLFMIQDLDSDFVNHFLNLMAKHKGKKNDIPAFMKLKEEMIEEMRLALFYKSLSGDNFQRTTANVFIVNDNQTGKVKAYRVQDLVNKAADNIKLLTGVKLNNKTLNTDLTFRNDWNDGSPEGRISGLLADVHATKVSASLHTSFLV